MFGMPKKPEAVVETIPTRESLEQILRELISGEFEIANYAEDEAGVFYLEAKVPGKSAGEYSEYIYVRKGTFEVDGRRVTGAASDVDVVYYKNNEPAGGDTAAKFVDGKWQRLV